MTEQHLAPLNTSKGQSLVEFVMVTPIMVLILLGAFGFGMGTYQAHMTSDAVQLPMLKTTEMANLPGPVSAGQLQGYIASGGLSGSLVKGNLVDKLQVNFITGIMVAQKNYIPLVDIIPGFTISVAHSLNPSLLKPTAFGGKSRQLVVPWVPGGAMQPPPWTEEGALPPP